MNKAPGFKGGLWDIGKTLSFCFRKAWASSKIYTILRFGFAVLTPLLSVGASYLVKTVIDELGGPQPEFRTLLNLMLASGLVSLALLVVGKARSYMASIQDTLVTNLLNVELMDLSLSSGLQLFDDAAAHDKIALASGNIGAVPNLLFSSIDFVSAVISVVSAFIVVFGYNPVYALLLLAAAIPTTIASSRYTEKLYALSVSQQNRARRKGYIYSAATDRLHAQDVRLNHTGGYLRAKYTMLWEELFAEQRGILRVRAVMTTLFQALPELVNIGILLHFISLIVGGAHTLGDFTFLRNMAASLVLSVSNVISVAVSLYDSRLRLSSIMELPSLDVKPPAGGCLPLESIHSITFRDVGFRYPGTEQSVLRGVSFEIFAGERVALVGVNGAGKSTIIKLMLGFYEPTEGSILVNGRPLGDYRTEDLHRHMSTYFQNAGNYAFTVRENLELTRPDENFDEARAEDALEKAGLPLKASVFPAGMDTHLTRYFDKEGVVLSEGQAQKMAMARVLYKDSNLLVLDEPSSSLDPEAEHRLFEKLRWLSEGKTTVFTSHRLSNITLATRVIVIEGGVVQEDGAPQALLHQRGRFYELYTVQAEKYSQV